MSRTDVPGDITGVDIDGPADRDSIVFVHGAVLTRKMWLPQRRSLSEAYHVVAPDLPGHGALADDRFRFEPAIDRLDDVVESVADGSTLLVGLSLGGYVSTEYVHRYPDKVEGLVLSGASANPVNTLELATRAVGGATRFVTRSDLVERGIDRLAARWVRNRDLPSDVEAEIIESGFYPKQFGDAGPYLAGHDFRSALGSYPGPTLVLNGEKDLVMRRGERKHATAARHGRVEVVEGAGHVCNLHRPEAYSAAVRRFHRRIVSTPQEPAE